MKKIGGNIACTLKYKSGYTNNSIGEKVPVEADYMVLTGFLDLANGDSKHINYDTKLQESTHIFICDYIAIDKKATELKAYINDKMYDVMLIDDPMELHEHLEIYLKYVGE